MNISKRESRSITTLCSLTGYSRQACYQHKKHLEKETLEHDLLINEVIKVRKTQKRLGGRKLLLLFDPLIQEH
jgi:putative transposase